MKVVIIYNYIYNNKVMIIIRTTDYLIRLR